MWLVMVLTNITASLVIGSIVALYSRDIEIGVYTFIVALAWIYTCQIAAMAYRADSTEKGDNNGAREHRPNH